MTFPEITQEAPRNAVDLQTAFAHAAEVATPSVVHITTRGPFIVPDAIGSGVIVSEQGHIVTNHHVVRFVKEGSVRFVDGSEFAATVVGHDSESDLALLKIDPGDRKLKPIAFADSDSVRVGDIVFAIGSPYGYNHTVTMGIVSAKHRKISVDKPYEDFVQTDASINPGNSGGALVNLNGELVGLNTAIVSENRANAGIGMAIASNLVRWVKDRLIRDGRVRRGYMGIGPLDLDPRLAREKFGEDHPLGAVQDQKDLLEALGLKEARGVLIATVVSRSPAAAVPLQPLDVLVELNGKPVRNSQDLFFRVAEIEPGSRVPLKFSRQGKLMQAQVELAERPPSGFDWPR